MVFSSPYAYYSYVKQDGQVYFKRSMIGYEPVLMPVVEADYDSFRGNMIYGKDKNHVYFRGVIMNQVDLDSFRVVHESQMAGLAAAYAKDNKYVYRGDVIIPQADPKTFVVPEDKRGGYWYSKDKNHVFEDTKIVEGIDPDGFMVLERDYLRNKKYLYWQKQIVKDADPETF